MKIEDALKIRGYRSRIVEVRITSPNWEYAGWGDKDASLWKAAVIHSDGQYGGGEYSAKGDTMESAIDAAVAVFQEGDTQQIGYKLSRDVKP